MFIGLSLLATMSVAASLDLDKAKLLILNLPSPISYQLHVDSNGHEQNCDNRSFCSTDRIVAGYLALSALSDFDMLRLLRWARSIDDPAPGTTASRSELQISGDALLRVKTLLCLAYEYPPAYHAPWKLGRGHVEFRPKMSSVVFGPGVIVPPVSFLQLVSFPRRLHSEQLLKGSLCEPRGTDDSEQVEGRENPWPAVALLGTKFI
ncbi:MAG: hypothetical protein HONBIEJF_02594 [Fimbriimonadaceae bacterium]|nr:hypothetical protein [Fimbriimonadaceae bacterium]